MKPSIWRRIFAALLVAGFACLFMVATGGASRVKDDPLERATHVVAQKHCAMYRSKRGKKRHHRRTCRSYKHGLTPLVPPARTSGLSEGTTGTTGSTGATGPDDGWHGCDTTQCFVEPPCNALPYPQQDASGTTGPWGVTGPDGPDVPYWMAMDTRFVGYWGCLFDRAKEWTDMPAEPTALFGDAGVQQAGPIYSNGPGIVRLVARVVNPGAADAELRVQYSADKTTWTYLDPVVPIGTPGLKVSGWLDAPPALYSTAPGYHPGYARVIGSGGDGVTDPSFSAIALQGWFPGVRYVP